MIKTNIVTVILSTVTIVSLTVAIMSLINQAKLKSLTETQSQQIAQLIQDKKDFQFSKTVNDDNSLTAIGDLKKTVDNLAKKIEPQKMDTSVLGTETTVPGEGMVKISVGISGSIYESPNEGANVLVEASPGAIMSYLRKENGWYQVQLDSGNLGWIEEKLVSESNL